MRKSKFTDSQILAVLKQAGRDGSATLLRHGINTATLYK